MYQPALRPYSGNFHNSVIQTEAAETTQVQNLLDEQFYLELVQIELLLQKDNKNLKLIQQATVRYGQCIEQYDSQQDPIKMYFQQKLILLLSKQDTLETVVNQPDQIFLKKGDSFLLQQPSIEIVEFDESIKRSQMKSSMLMSQSDDEQLEDKLDKKLSNKNQLHLMHQIKQNPNNLINVQKRKANLLLEVEKDKKTQQKGTQTKNLIDQLEQQSEVQEKVVQDDLKKQMDAIQEKLKQRKQKQQKRDTIIIDNSNQPSSLASNPDQQKSQSELQDQSDQQKSILDFQNKNSEDNQSKSNPNLQPINQASNQNLPSTQSQTQNHNSEHENEPPNKASGNSNGNSNNNNDNNNNDNRNNDNRNNDNNINNENENEESKSYEEVHMQEYQSNSESEDMYVAQNVSKNQNQDDNNNTNNFDASPLRLDQTDKDKQNTSLNGQQIVNQVDPLLFQKVQEISPIVKTIQDDNSTKEKDSPLQQLDGQNDGQIKDNINFHSSNEINLNQMLQKVNIDNQPQNNQDSKQNQQ